MRVVADTNTVISGILWQGNPRRVLDAARDDLIELYTSRVLLEELKALSREKFASRLSLANLTAKYVVRNFSSVAVVIEPAPIKAVILRDPDDDTVLACALSASCDVIVFGDNDLLDLKEHLGIRILTATQILAELML